MTPFEVIDFESSEIKIKARKPVTVKSAITEPIKSEQVNNVIIEVASPNCPKCNEAMVQRVAKKGARQGQLFFGCSQFPKCRGTVNLGEL